jgi:hypothetical protein
MKKRYKEHTQTLIDKILHSPGETSDELRHAVERYSAELSGRTIQAAEPVPASLEPYITKVALYAYRITDQDIEALHMAGYSEDAIFELTLSAALGASIARLERGLTALKGG